MQGHLRGEKLTFEIETGCGHCGRPIHIAIDSDLNTHVREAGAEPLVHVPMVDVQKLPAPSIIEGF
ncbi:MAG: hypothetical protein JW934_20905 [Anaerolineae bacterium]|nr:hypothetical protein [Anaerolineae bacterium]